MRVILNVLFKRKMMGDKMSRLVSVIVPSWNRKDYLEKCLKSIWDQNDDHLEVIVVDDGSKDGTEPFIQNLQKEHPNLFYVQHPTNLGLAAARNTGIKNAKGAYLAFLDSDDIWMPEKLLKQRALFETDPSIDFIFTNGFFNTKDSYISSVPMPSGYIVSGPKVWPLKNICPEPSGWIFKKKVLQKTGYFDETFVRECDGDFFVRVCQHDRVYYLNEPLFFKYYSPNDFRNEHQRLIWIEKFFEKHKDWMMQDRPYYWTFLKMMGKDYRRLGNVRRAKEFYQKALSVYPWRLSTYLKYFRLLF